MSKNNYYVGQVWIMGFGNGIKRDTIIRIIDNFRVELAGAGIVQKSWLRKQWISRDEMFV